MPSSVNYKHPPTPLNFATPSVPPQSEFIPLPSYSESPKFSDCPPTADHVQSTPAQPYSHTTGKPYPDGCKVCVDTGYLSIPEVTVQAHCYSTDNKLIYDITTNDNCHFSFEASVVKPISPLPDLCSLYGFNTELCHHISSMTHCHLLVKNMIQTLKLYILPKH